VFIIIVSILGFNVGFNIRFYNVGLIILGTKIYPTSHYDKNCCNVTINVSIVIAMSHYIAINSTSHSNIAKLWLNVRVYNIVLNICNLFNLTFKIMVAY